MSKAYELTKISRSEVITTELEKLETQNGLLTPEKVVEAASDPNSPIHRYFEWNDGEAAHRYRVWQARVLIFRCRIKITNADETQVRFPMRVALMQDRKDGGGYRKVTEIMENPVQRNELMNMALTSLKNWQSRYEMLKDLVDSVSHAVKPFEIENEEK